MTFFRSSGTLRYNDSGRAPGGPGRLGSGTVQPGPAGGECRMKTITRIVSAVTASVAISGAGALVVTQAQAAPGPASAAACATHWGVGAKVVSRAENEHTARVTGARAGQHACFDRLVIDIGGRRTPGYPGEDVAPPDAPGRGQGINPP